MRFDKQRIMQLREQGHTYSQIAGEIGCTKQYVGQICGKTNPNQFRYVTESECIYPNFRKWLNENKVSRKEFIRLSSIFESTGSSALFGYILKGISHPTKPQIDKMIETTGIPYEVLFSKVEYQATNAVPATQYNELLRKYNELLDAADTFCDIYLNHRREYCYEIEDE